MDMTNQCVGDALSDMLLVESVLCAKGWDVQDWFESYQVNWKFKVLLYHIKLLRYLILSYASISV